jgi:two-component sensor histidine kinase
VAADAGRFEDEGWRLRKDGSAFWANVVITAVRDRQGVLIGFTKVTRDLTERRHAEEQVRQRTAELSRTLGEREVLLQEVHHRVKNNLQVISSLINMQARTLEGGAGRDALDECQGRIQAIALIHEKLYQSPDYANIPFSEYARALAESVFCAIGACSQNVRLDLALEECTIAVDKAIPCGLILNELMSNACRHAFCDGRSGRIRVELAKADDQLLRLTVRDNGLGFPDGFEVSRDGSLGLQLVRMLVRQIDGTLTLEAGSGTCLRLEVPTESRRG